ncbi:hypothetical protein T459_32377 [Capsicum annuum]|uniref:Ubiquitin-like protease family profile domain-containing protein n=1 Tax=Capsicum annuum TaxID=4072 RepID=A0A2G2Y282_CAPAN|nr:hypothetical protein T459_32377 [Capsicum annuum]
MDAFCCSYNLPNEIQQLVVILPSYLPDSDIFEKTERIDWSTLEADCGVFVAAYADILSEAQQVHSCGFDVGSQSARYDSLLWHYKVTKEKEGYTSDNDDPPRPRNSYLQSTDESAIVTLE